MHTSNKYNLTKTEFKALKELKDSEDLIIKPADKGGGIVLMSKDKYVEQARTMLEEDETYDQLKSDPSKEIKKKFCEFLERGRLMNILTKREYDYMNLQHPKIPIFYWLPKVHKDIQNPQGRPIIAGIDAASSRVSEYIDVLLQPLVKSTPAYIKDTID